jgi:hypothetical protein
MRIEVHTTQAELQEMYHCSAEELKAMVWDQIPHAIEDWSEPVYGGEIVFSGITVVIDAEAAPIKPE